MTSNAGLGSEEFSTAIGLDAGADAYRSPPAPTSSPASIASGSGKRL